MTEPNILYVADTDQDARRWRGLLPPAHICGWGSQSVIGLRYTMVILLGERHPDLWFRTSIRPVPILRLTTIACEPL